MGRLGRKIYNNVMWPRLRSMVLKRANWTCQKCKRVSGRLECDHVIALTWRGAPFDPKNLQALCRFCHQEKTASENFKTPLPGQREWKGFVRELAE